MLAMHDMDSSTSTDFHVCYDFCLYVCYICFGAFVAVWPKENKGEFVLSPDGCGGFDHFIPRVGRRRCVAASLCKSGPGAIFLQGHFPGSAPAGARVRLRAGGPLPVPLARPLDGARRRGRRRRFSRFCRGRHVRGFFSGIDRRALHLLQADCTEAGVGGASFPSPQWGR